jgi:ATP-dependent Clp protease adaptor protein ClpS
MSDRSIPRYLWSAGAPEAWPGAPDVEVDVLEEDETQERIDDPWRVILYNDDIHSFDEVIFQVMKATGCSESQAEAYAWEAHINGKAAVYEGSFEDCFRVQGVLREIQLVTEIEG